MTVATMARVHLRDVPLDDVGARAKDASAAIPSLDGLRAVSFLLVFAAHAGLSKVVPGGFGVTVFFFLSGFLITSLMRQEHTRTATVSLKHFYLRRALRILPPFYLVLALACGLSAAGVLHGALEWQGVLSQILHVANYWTIANGEPRGLAAGTGVYWSLAVEEHFYLVFPLLFLVLARRRVSYRRVALVLLGLCALILAWRTHLVVDGASFARTNAASDTRFDSILFGCVLALWRDPALDTAPVRPALWKRVLLPLGLVGLLLSFIIRGDVFRDSIRYTLQGLSLIPVFVVAIRWPTSALMRPLNSRILRFLGGLSYSLYLVHFVVLHLLEDNVGALSPAARAVVALAISIAVAWGISIAIEKPCARLRKRLSSTSAPRKRAVAMVRPRLA